MKMLNSIIKKCIIPLACSVIVLTAIVPNKVNAGDIESQQVVLDETGAINDYSFVIIQDEEVPLAALPAQTDHSGHVVWVVFMSIMAVLILFYGATILVYNNRVKAIEPLMTEEDIKEIRQLSIVFNPFRHNDVLAAKESDLASR